MTKVERTYEITESLLNRLITVLELSKGWSDTWGAGISKKPLRDLYALKEGVLPLTHESIPQTPDEEAVKD